MTQRTRTRETRERSRARIVEAATELVRERSYAEALGLCDLDTGEEKGRVGIPSPSQAFLFRAPASAATSTTSR